MAVLTECETQLLAMQRQLTENPQVQIFSVKPGQIIEEYGDAPEVFEKISILHGIDLDPSLQRCFVRFSWFSSHWRIERPEIQLTGEFTIRHLLTSMNVNAPDIDWGETPSERQLYSELRVIDHHPGSGTGTFAALRIKPDMPQPEVWFHDFRIGAFKMDIDYCDYLAALTITKGTSGWHYLFCDVSLGDREFRHIARQLEDMLTVFSELFPEYDYASLRQRLDERLR
ncbi:hypothetical protein QFZ24_007635 [Streptomyces phaeochromogenes]|jgi:hypothetical protein|uniref:hypothetical protein n=1 Tax=Streptomyces phaeochromogenes TaxID=1923 RepID=UPI00278DF297|nr:hypothetical protein [Streptomyces phaeochromogenes]MDQ0953712.1 hypothetical protein [Streptomyces phaeochromogenes]